MDESAAVKGNKNKPGTNCEICFLSYKSFAIYQFKRNIILVKNGTQPDAGGRYYVMK